MLNGIIEFASKIANLLWGPWTMIFIGFVATYLTIRSGALQFTKFGTIMKNTIGKMFKKDTDPLNQGITPFQATATALAGTVGMGNIAGVASAISVGGPGAVFWMWVFALLGMISKTAEVTLAVHYREVGKDGSIKGGPMYYMTKGLGWKTLAKLFSIGVLINAFLAAGLLQPHTVGRALLSSYNINPYITTIVLASITGYVVIKGDKRIGQFCERLVPFMSLFYIAIAIIIFVLKYNHIPGVFGLIFASAFKPSAAVGGFAGAAVTAAIRNGMSRGMLSNEAGLGTAPMVHAKANVAHPMEQGMWGAFEVFFDTIVICSLTAFVILSTGVLGTGLSGVELTLSAFGNVFPKFVANITMAVLIITFCLSTQIGFFIYYETAVENVFGIKSMKVFKWLYLVPGVIFAGVSDVNALWVFADIATGVCAIPNLIGVLALSGVYLELQKDYFLGKNQYLTAIIDKNRNYVRKAKGVTESSK